MTLQGQGWASRSLSRLLFSYSVFSVRESTEVCNVSRSTFSIKAGTVSLITFSTGSFTKEDKEDTIVSVISIEDKRDVIFVLSVSSNMPFNSSRIILSVISGTFSLNVLSIVSFMSDVSDEDTTSFISSEDSNEDILLLRVF